MEDVEAQNNKNINSAPTKFSVILCVKTLIHGGYLVLHHFVGIWAANMIYNLTEENIKKPLLRDLKYFATLFLTNWNYLFQTVFLFLALSHDVLEWASKQDSTIAGKIRYWRDVIFSGLVVPYTCFVFGMFWSLYAIDRELVFPRVYDDVVPWWFNQCVHSNIMALLVIETILQARRHPRDRRLELIFNGAVGILYAIVYYSIYFFAGRWLYNVFGLMTWWQVCLFQLLIWGSSYVFYEMQFPINRLIHGKDPEPQKQEISTVSKTVEQNGGQTKGDVKDGHEIKETNGHFENGLNQNGENKNGDLKNGGLNTKTDFQVPPFSTKSWSLKYRTIRSQFENTNL